MLLGCISTKYMTKVVLHANWLTKLYGKPFSHPQFPWTEIWRQLRKLAANHHMLIKFVKFSIEAPQVGVAFVANPC